MMSARQEVYKTLQFCNFCTSKIAISFIDELPTKFLEKLRVVFWYLFSTGNLAMLIIGEFAFVKSCAVGESSSVAAFASSLHIVGYGTMSLCKCIMIWLKRSVFRKVVNDLVELWPVDVTDQETADVKNNSVSRLRLVQFSYMCWNFGGCLLYALPQLIIYLYHLCRGENAELGFVWAALYPFDKNKPIYHELVFLFEAYSGTVSVLAMLGSDMMFTAMSSNISMLLRILHIKIRGLGHCPNDPPAEINGCESNQPIEQQNVDCYDEIVSVIKIHQRLISYRDELEDVFSVVNLINVLLSSVNICCVVFNIVLLEPWMEMSNKFFLGATLTQVGIICWYADDIYRASVGVADAVYGSGWYKANGRCRRALLLLLQRSQKPLYFTALKFSSITMSTYSSILTTSYSYFALLYTMYSN